MGYMSPMGSSIGYIYPMEQFSMGYTCPMEISIGYMYPMELHVI